MIDKDPIWPSGLGFASDEQTDGSRSLFRRARATLAGGVSSSGRSVTTGPLPYPLCMTRGRGARIQDVDGNEFIDYLLGYGSAILGHGPPGLAEKLAERIAQGTILGTVSTLEIDLARRIQEQVPCAELIRFANSGTEAVCAAIRAARGATGHSKVIKFEGHYHGWLDPLAASIRPAAEECGPLESPASVPHSRGIPRGIIDDVIVCPWNRPDILRRILSRFPGEIAAIIAEPIVANNACIMPEPGFLQLLRDECDDREIVLIFDEVSTGFRIAPGGAPERFGVHPDLAVYSKAVGGGLPISVLAGRRRIMDLIATNEVRHGGTYNGNSLCVCAALHTLDELLKPEIQDRLKASGSTLMAALEDSARKYRVPCVVLGVEQMFQVVFGLSDAPRQYRELLRADFARYDRFRHLLLMRGVHVTHSPLAAWFVSAAHATEDVELTVDAIDDAMKHVAG